MEAERMRQQFLHQVANPQEHADGWDETIMSFFINQPRLVILIMRAVNVLTKQHRYACKKHREQAKILVMRSIGRLIQEGRLKRVRRRYVSISAAELPPKPIIPLGALMPDAAKLEATIAAGSTPARLVIHPGVFM